MIYKITPNSIDTLVKLLKNSSEVLKAYFPLYNGDFADHTAKVNWNNSKFQYKSGGHGIGWNPKRVKNIDDVINNIIADNKRFNNNKEFHIEIQE